MSDASFEAMPRGAFVLQESQSYSAEFTIPLSDAICVLSDSSLSNGDGDMECDVVHQKNQLMQNSNHIIGSDVRSDGSNADDQSQHPDTLVVHCDHSAVSTVRGNSHSPPMTSPAPLLSTALAASEPFNPIPPPSFF